MTKTETKLKPCAHCGGQAEIDRNDEPAVEDRLYWIMCKDCHIQTEPLFEEPDFEAWNRRHDDKD